MKVYLCRLECSNKACASRNARIHSDVHGSPEEALADVQRFAKSLGWDVERELCGKCAEEEKEHPWNANK